jgi:hypothetical protein
MSIHEGRRHTKIQFLSSGLPRNNAIESSKDKLLKIKAPDIELPRKIKHADTLKWYCYNFLESISNQCYSLARKGQYSM